jgi:hypothetical protein
MQIEEQIAHTQMTIDFFRRHLGGPGPDAAS